MKKFVIFLIIILIIICCIAYIFLTYRANFYDARTQNLQYERAAELGDKIKELEERTNC